MERVLTIIVNLLLLLLGVRLFQELRRNKKKRPCPDPDVVVDTVIAPFVPDQLIVWRKPDVSASSFDQWKAELLNRHSGITVKKLCEYCDDSLELWEGDNVTTVITEKTVGASGGSNGGGLSGGGDAVAAFSYNFILDLPEPEPCVPPVEKYSRPQEPLAGPALTVAVFDTGLLGNLKTTYTQNVDSCMPGGNLGWNFAYKNKDTEDDHPSTHGSAVTQFIMDQQAQYRLQKINLLPVKVHNNLGKSDLFSILCGFAYAANCGAKIINASFGFYAAKNSGPPAILAGFVKRILSRNNILLIAAAGNVNADKSVGRNNAQDVRDLEKHPFFPACLSKDFENVLTVTTVSEANGDVSPSQNYANRIVDIGVDCDQIVSGDYRFADSLGRNTLLIGSSYATPIVAGKIAQHYNALTSGMAGGINKSILLSRMQQMGLLTPNLLLSQYVRDGNCTKK